MGLLSRVRDGLRRTAQQLIGRFDEIATRADAPERRSLPVDAETAEALEELLIGADVGVAAAERIVTAVRGRARRGESLRDLVKDELRAIVGGAADDGAAPPGLRPWCCGRRQRHGQDDDRRQAGQSLQVAGTRSAGVRGRHVPRGGRRAARRSGRPRVGVDVIRAKDGSDPAAVVFDALAAGQGAGTFADHRRYGRAPAHPREPDAGTAEDPPDRRRARSTARRTRSCSCSTPRSGRTA